MLLEQVSVSQSGRLIAPHMEYADFSLISAFDAVGNWLLLEMAGISQLAFYICLTIYATG